MTAFTEPEIHQTDINCIALHLPITYKNESIFDDTAVIVYRLHRKNELSANTARWLLYFDAGSCSIWLWTKFVPFGLKRGYNKLYEFTNAPNCFTNVSGDVILKDFESSHIFCSQKFTFGN